MCEEIARRVKELNLNYGSYGSGSKKMMRGSAQYVFMTILFMVYGTTIHAAKWPNWQLSSTLVSVMQEEVDESSEEDDLGEDDLGEDELLDEIDEELAEEDQPKEIEVGGENIGESLGGATGFVFPTGFYVSSDLGGFIRFGGYGDDRSGTGCLRCLPKLYSDLQPWIGLNIGYDILPWIGIETTFATGFIGDSAPYGYNGTDPSVTPPVGVEDSPENSAVSMVNLALTGSWYFFDRLGIQGKIFGGGALLTPDPDPSHLNLVRSFTCEAGGWGDPSPDKDCGGQFGSDAAASFGVGLGLRYATLLTNVVIGFDVNMVGVYNPLVQTSHLGFEITQIAPVGFGFAIPIIPAVSFAPVLKYVF